MPGPNSPSRLDASYISVWTLSAGVFYDRHQVDIPPQGASFTNNVLFLDGFLRARDGYKPIPVALDSLPAIYIDLFRPILETGDRSGALMVVKKHPSGRLDIYKLTLSTDCSTAGIPTAATKIGEIPVAAIPIYYQQNLSGNLEPVFDTTGNPNFAQGGSPGGLIDGSSTNFKGNWYFTNGRDDIFRYDGSTWIPLRTLQPDPDLQNPIGAKIITSNDARLFLANCIDPESGVRVPYRVAWSGTLEDNRWGGSYYRSGTSTFLDLAGENDPITAMYTSSDFVIVFKPRTIYIGQFVGAPQFYSFRRLVRGPGCISQHTLVEYRDGLLIWLGDDNVYAGLPGQKPQPLGSAIEERIREVANLCRMDEARAIINRDQHIYTIFLPILDSENPHLENATVQNYKIFTCHIPTGAWFEGTIQSPAVNPMSGLEVRVNWWSTSRFVSSYDGQVYQQDLNFYEDKDVPFECEYITGVFNYERVTEGGTQQADVQVIRVQSIEGSVDLSLISGNNLDRFTESAYGTQDSDGTSQLYVTKRDKTSENFKVKMYKEEAEDFGKIAALSFSAVPEGDTHRYR